MAKKSDFHQLQFPLREKLSALGRRHSFVAGDVLLHSSVRPDGVWLIEEGVVEGIADYPGTVKSQVVEEFAAHEIVGWLGIIQDNWIEFLRVKTSLCAIFIGREVFLSTWNDDSSLRRWCRKQTLAIEVVYALHKLSAHSTQRLFQLSEWQHHYIINQIAQKEINYCSKDVVDIPGGNWHFIDGGVCRTQDKNLLTNDSRVLFISSAKEDSEDPASAKLSRSSLSVRKNQDQCEKTVIVVGNARGGTPMVAKIIATMGVDVGTTSQESLSLEDKLFRYDLYGNEKHEDIVMRMKSAIESNNASKGVWGWKYPRASVYLEGVIESVRNPYLICVYRDVFACAIRRVREALDCRVQSQALEQLIAEESRQCLANIELVERLALPTMMCSYEKIISHPSDFIDAASSFLDIPVDQKIKQCCLDSIHPGSYGDPIASAC